MKTNSITFRTHTRALARIESIAQTLCVGNNSIVGAIIGTLCKTIEFGPPARPHFCHRELGAKWLKTCNSEQE